MCVCLVRDGGVSGVYKYIYIHIYIYIYIFRFDPAKLARPKLPSKSDLAITKNQGSF